MTTTTTTTNAAGATQPADAQPVTAAHTPGPWAVAINRNLPHRPLEIHGRNGGACVASGLGDGPEAQANARLIASAPALLAERDALRALLGDVGQWLESNLKRGRISCGTANRDGDLVTQIRAALAGTKA